MSGLDVADGLPTGGGQVTFRHGARTGEWSPLMAQVARNLEQEDMLATVAYLASLDP
jgi:cytochrome c553